MKNSKLVIIITALLVFGISLFFAPAKVESSHGQAGPATSCTLSNYQNIPETVTANTPMQFTATFSPALSPPYTLLGRICINKDGSSQGCSLKDGSGNLVPWGTALTAGTTYNYSFTPSDPGTYKVFCSSTNANDYECRGATQGDIDSLGRNDTANHRCEGGTSSKGFTVAAAAAPPAAAAPAQPPESTPNIRQSTRRNGDTVQIDFSATDKSGSGIKEIVVAIWEGAANFQEKWFPLESAPAGKRGRYEPIQNASSGTIQVKVPSYIEYYAVDNNNNKENNGQGKSFLVSATDNTSPSTSITKPGDPASYVKRQLITLKYISDYDRKVGSIRRKAIRVTEDVTLSTEAEIQNYISTHQDAWNQARTVEMRPDPPLNHVEMDDLEPIRIPAVVEYFAIGEDDRSETKKYAFIPASNPEQTAKVRIAESEADLNDGGTYIDYNFSDLTATGSDPNRRSARVELRGFGQKTIFVRYISNAGNTRDETFGTITYAPLANCSNLRGPDRGFVGEELLFTANFLPPAGAPAFDLKGDIAAGIDGGDDKRECSSKADDGCTNLTDLNDSGENDKQMTVRFSQPETYTVFCEAFNLTQFVECRGDQRFVTGSTNPRVRVCAGPSSSKPITIERDEIPPTTTITINPSTNINRGSNVAVTLRSSDTQSKVRTVFVGIWKNKKSKAEATGNPDITCEYGNTTNNCPGVSSTTLEDGTVQIEFRDIPLPSYIETNAIDYSGNQEKDIVVQQIAGNLANAHPVDSDDKEPPTSLATPTKASGAVKYDEEVDVRFIVSDGTLNRGVRVVFVGVWEGVTTKTTNPTKVVELSREQLRDGIETVKIKAPFYIEFHAEDINGNVEVIPDTEEGSVDIPGGRRAHTRVVDVDKVAPNKDGITVSPSKTTNVNNGDEVALDIAASDNEGGSGIAVIHTAVWEGVFTLEERDRKLQAENKSLDKWTNPDNRPVYEGISGASGRRVARVPFVVSIQAEDASRANPPDQGQTGRKGNVSEAKIYFLKSDDTEPPTSNNAAITTPANRTGYARGEDVTVSFSASDDRGNPVNMNIAYWEEVSTKQEMLQKYNNDSTQVIGAAKYPTADKPREITAKAPFYVEYHAVDKNGNVEIVTSADKVDIGGGKFGHGLSVPLDTTVPTTVGDITIENQPADVNIGTEVDLKFTASDEQGGSGLKTINTAVWEGVASKNERDAKITSLGLTYDQAVTQWKDKVNVAGSPAREVYLGVDNNAVRKAKVPFYAEARAEDNCNCVPKTGGGFTGNVTVDADMKTKQLDHNDQERPTNSTVTVKGAADANKTSGFAEGEEVELTFSGQDTRGIRVIHTGLWEGVSTKQEAIQRAREQGKNFEDWQNTTNPLYQGVANNGKRRARVPFYLEYVAEDINGNLENVSIPPGVDDGADKPTPGGVHAFAIEIPTQTEKIRIVEGDQGLLDTCNPATCEKPFNSNDPKISFPLSGGTGSKTIWVRFINNKRRNPVDVSKRIRVLSSSEGVSFVFSPDSVTANPGGAQFEVAVQLNTRSTIMDYNISAVDIKLKLNNAIYFDLVNFVPNAQLFETVGSIIPTSTDVRFVGRRKTESASLTGIVELGKIQLRPIVSLLAQDAHATRLFIEESTAQVTSSDVVGPVPIAKPIAQATLSLGPSSSPSPSPRGSASPVSSPSAPICLQVITWARNVQTRVCRLFTTSCLDAGWVEDQTCVPSGSPSPGPSVSPGPLASPRVSPSPGQELACDFNLNGRYDEGDNDPQTLDDLQIWTEVTLERRSIAGTTPSGFSWDADCASDPDEGTYTNKDGRVNLIDLNRWARLKQGFETP